MYKLLPDEEKVLIKSEYKLRRLVILASFFIGILLITIVALFPSYLITITKEKDAKQRMSMLNKALTQNQGTDFGSWLKILNTKIKLFASNQDADKPYEGFIKIISLKSGGIVINEISFNKGAADKDQYEVGGTATDRRSLINFQNNLNKSSDFQNANVPISDLAKDKNIDFRMNLDVKK